MRVLKVMAVAAAIATGATGANAASLLVNGDFEAGATGFTSDYLSYGPAPDVGIGPAGTYAVATDLSVYHPVAPAYGDHTTGSGNMMGVNGNGIVDGRAFWRQTVGVAAGASYTFSMFTSNWAGTSAPIHLIINGAMVGATLTPSSTGLWVESVFVPWASGAATSATLELIFVDPGKSNGAAVDDLSFVAAQVPIPAALPLMLAGLCALTLAGRKRAA